MKRIGLIILSALLAAVCVFGSACSAPKADEADATATVTEKTETESNADSETKKEEAEGEPEKEDTQTPPAEDSAEPEATLEDILSGIVKDYYYYRVENSTIDPASMGEFYVRDYYGDFDGAVPVIIVGTRYMYPEGEYEETVAGHVFKYSSFNSIEVWKDGAFYTLQESYDSGILTEEQIGQIAEATPTQYNVMEIAYPAGDEVIDYEYLAAKRALCVLDEATKTAIAETVGIPDLIWLDEEKLKDSSFYEICSYGEFDGCVVLFSWGDADVEETVVIADSMFYYHQTFNLYAYCNNTLYTLEEAYEQELIGADDIAKAAENHSIIQSYLNGYGES